MNPIFEADTSAARGAAACRRYEDLRAAVFTGCEAGWRHGWAVLARSGMAVWARVVTAINPGPRIGEPTPSAFASGPAATPGGAVEAELVHVLAALVLGRLKPP